MLCFNIENRAWISEYLCFTLLKYYHDSCIVQLLKLMKGLKYEKTHA